MHWSTGVVLQVLVCGAELFTSNAALMPVAYYEKKASLQQVKTLQQPLLCFADMQAYVYPGQSGHHHHCPKSRGSLLVHTLVTNPDKLKV